MKGREKGKRKTKKRPRCPICGRVVTKSKAWAANPFFHATCATGEESAEGAPPQ